MRLLLGLNVCGMEPVVPVGKASGKGIRYAMSVLPKVKRLVQNRLRKKVFLFCFLFLMSEILYEKKMKKKDNVM